MRYPNALAALRDRVGMTQEDVAAAAGISASYYGELERGMRRLNADLAQRLCGALRCTAGELLTSAATPAVPLRIVVAGAFAGQAGALELAEPYQMLPAPRQLTQPEACIAAEVADDSADRDYPRGSTLFIRRIDEAGAALPLGSKIVVRFGRAGGFGRPPAYEILYGRLERSTAGDLILATRSHSREIPRSLVIRPAPRQELREGEPAAARVTAVDYRPAPADEAVILGTIVFSWRPE